MNEGKKRFRLELPTIPTSPPMDKVEWLESRPFENPGTDISAQHMYASQTGVLRPCHHRPLQAAHVHLEARHEIGTHMVVHGRPCKREDARERDNHDASFALLDPAPQALLLHHHPGLLCRELWRSRALAAPYGTASTDAGEEFAMGKAS